MRKNLDTPLTVKIDKDLKKALDRLGHGNKSEFIKKVLRLALAKLCPHCGGHGFVWTYEYTNYGMRDDGTLGPMPKERGE